MDKTTRFLGACLIAAGLCGCSSNDYQPTPGMTAEQIFADTCAKCHGENGEGKFGFLLTIAGSETGSEEIVAKIRLGGHLMPAFPNIGEAEAEALANYVKSR